MKGALATAISFLFFLFPLPSLHPPECSERAVSSGDLLCLQHRAMARGRSLSRRPGHSRKRGRRRTQNQRRVRAWWFCTQAPGAGGGLITWLMTLCHLPGPGVEMPALLGEGPRRMRQRQLLAPSPHGHSLSAYYVQETRTFVLRRWRESRLSPDTETPSGDQCCESHREGWTCCAEGDQRWFLRN